MLLQCTKNDVANRIFVRSLIVSVLAHNLLFMLFGSFAATKVKRPHVPAIYVELAALGREVSPEISRVKVIPPVIMTGPARPAPAFAGETPSPVPASRPVIDPAAGKTMHVPAAEPVAREPKLFASPVKETASPQVKEPAGGRPVKEPVLTGAGQSVRQQYLGLIRSLIDRQKEYPLMARKGGMEGTVHVKFLLARDGRIKQAEVSRSSGRSLLDNASLRTVQRIGMFPPVPEAMAGGEIAIELPVVYTLGSN